MSHRDSVDGAAAGARVSASSASHADRRVRGRGARALRRPVPPRGRAHAARPGDAQELPLRGRRRAADVDARGGDRGAGRADPRRRSAPSGCSARCPAASTPRSPRCSCTRRSATSSRASSSTTGCCGRTRPSRSSRRSAATSTSRSCTCERAGAVPRAARRRHRPRDEAQDRSARSSSASSRRRRAHSATSRFLVQGTLYSDVIESGGDDGVAATIKTHHNVGGLPGGHGDRARRAAARCSSRTRCAASARSSACRSGWSGASRSPAPASRSASSARSPRSGSTSCARPTRSCWRRSASAGLYRELWQCFAVLPAIRSVGVQGDERTYALPDRDPGRHLRGRHDRRLGAPPVRLLEAISTRIINEVPGVNRVVLDISSKPPATIEWE